MDFHKARVPYFWSLSFTCVACCVCGGLLNTRITRAQIAGGGEGSPVILPSIDTPKSDFRSTACEDFTVTGIENAYEKGTGFCVAAARVTGPVTSSNLTVTRSYEVSSTSDVQSSECGNTTASHTLSTTKTARLSTVLSTQTDTAKIRYRRQIASKGWANWSSWSTWNRNSQRNTWRSDFDVSPGIYELEVTQLDYCLRVTLPEFFTTGTKVEYRLDRRGTTWNTVSIPSDSKRALTIDVTKSGAYETRISAKCAREDYNGAFSPPSVTVPCPRVPGARNMEHTYTLKVAGPDGAATCGTTIKAPLDTCGRSDQKVAYQDPDCCAGMTVADIPILTGSSWGDPKKANVGKFKGKNAKKSDSRDDVWWTSERYADGYINWACVRNSNAVTAALTDNLALNLAWLGASNKWDWVHTKIRPKLEPGQSAANYCFACGQVRTVDGCLPPGTRVVMSDRSTKAVEDIRAGDRIWNPLLKRSFKVMTISQGPERSDLIVVVAGRKRLRMTLEHPVLTSRGIKQAKDLVRGDTLTDASSTVVSIDSITREPASPGLSVLNFIVERVGSKHDGLLVADGLIVGDLLVQRRLAAYASKK